jgi:hypothetical protein
MHPLHPACAAWPQMDEPALAELAEDIKIKGLIEPIVLLDGQILDGRNRELACEKAGVEPRYTQYEGDDPIGFVLSKNKNRRHMTTSQLAMTVARLSQIKNGGDRKSETYKISCFGEATDKTMPQLAKESGVGVSTIGFAKSVLYHGEPNVIALVDSGEAPVGVAAVVVSRTTREAQARMSKDDILRAGRAVIDAYPSNKQRSSARAAERPRTSKPPQKSTGFAALGDNWYAKGAEKDPNGPRVQIRSMAAQELVNAHIQVCDCVMALRRFASEHNPSIETFFQLIERLLAHTPQRDAWDDRKRDFAAEARRQLALAEEAIDNAVGRTLKLKAALVARRAVKSV